MKHIGLNVFAPVEAVADQLARPIVRQRPRLLDPDWESLREFSVQLARETRRVTPYVRPVLVPCETCQGEGRILRSNGGPDDIDCGECPECEGRGTLLVDSEPYVPARVTDEQFDADRAVDSREWADD